MSADRFTINTDDGIFIQHPFAANMTVPQMFEGAIRQQARDIAQLRTDLAAAVSENASLLAANRDCILHFDAIKADYDAMKLRAEQAEARLAAIDAAPVVASVGHGDYLHRHTASVPVGTLLIARLAKD